MSQKDSLIIDCTVAVPPIYHSEPELEVYDEGKTRLKGYRRSTTPHHDVHAFLFLSVFPNRVRPIVQGSIPDSDWKQNYDDAVDDWMYRAELPFVAAKWTRADKFKGVERKKLTTLEKRIGSHVQGEMRAFASAYGSSVPKSSVRERYSKLQNLAADTELEPLLLQEHVQRDLSKTYMRASLCVLYELMREEDPLVLKYAQMLAARANRSYAEAKRHWRDIISQIGA